MSYAGVGASIARQCGPASAGEEVAMLVFIMDLFHGIFMALGGVLIEAALTYMLDTVLPSLREFIVRLATGPIQNLGVQVGA